LKIVTVKNAERALASIFWTIFCCVIIILLSDPQLGPYDEYHFLPTLQHGKWFPMYGADFPYYDSDALGRFLPLAGQEYNFAALFSRTPLSYYLLNVFELTLAVLLFFQILKRATNRKILKYISAIFLLLVPALAIAFGKLLYVDRGVFLFCGILIYGYMRYCETSGFFYWLITLIAANIAIYYKEPAFAIVLAFSLSNLAIGIGHDTRGRRWLNLMLAGSALVYLSIYFTQIAPGVRAPFVESSAPISIFIKNLFNYAFFSDPLVFLGLFPLLIFRLWIVFVRKAQASPIFDSMLVAAVGYASVFLVLNIYAPYYMLPAYMLGMPPFIKFVVANNARGKFWNLQGCIIIAVTLLNAAPLSIHYYTYNKYVASNFHQTILFLVEEINRRNENKRIPIFFEGVDRGNGRGVYYVVGEYLRFHGLSIRKFDLKSNMDVTLQEPFQGNISPLEIEDDLRQVLRASAMQFPQYPFTVFQPGPITMPQSGDYLVVSPQSTLKHNAAMQSDLDRDYKLVFSAEGRFAVPRIGIKTAVKQMLISRLSEDDRQKLIANENLMNWPNYYVYVKK
jgi:hypothetical protein